MMQILPEAAVDPQVRHSRNGNVGGERRSGLKAKRENRERGQLTNHPRTEHPRVVDVSLHHVIRLEDSAFG